MSHRYVPCGQVAADPYARSGLRPWVEVAAEEELSRKHRRSIPKALVLTSNSSQLWSQRCDVAECEPLPTNEVLHRAAVLQGDTSLPSRRYQKGLVSGLPAEPSRNLMSVCQHCLYNAWNSMLCRPRF